jgi:hypothetical protein
VFTGGLVITLACLELEKMLMVFIGLVIIIAIVFFVFLHKQAHNYKFSKTILILFIVSVLANVSLAQNYTQSLIPGIEDGIGISNKLAYYIITDEGWGNYWSRDLFYRAYDYSITISGIIIILFIISLFLESKRKNR